MTNNPLKRPLQAASRISVRDTWGSGAAVETFGLADSSQLRHVPTAQIHPNPNQPRKRFDETALAELAGSIEESGLLQPPVVRVRAAGGYEIIAGERRWRAARLAGVEAIPVIVREDDDTNVVALALLENVARQDLTPVEEAHGLAALLETGASKERVARQLGRSRSDISNTVRLLGLPDGLLELIDAGRLSKGHGKVLLGVDDAELQLSLAERAVEEGWSVRALEQRLATATAPPPEQETPDDERAAMATRLAELISSTGFSARVRPHREHGYRVTLQLADDSDVERLQQLLKVTSR